MYYYINIYIYIYIYIFIYILSYISSTVQWKNQNTDFLYIHIYIYIYRERYIERDIYIHTYIYFRNGLMSPVNDNQRALISLDYTMPLSIPTVFCILFSSFCIFFLKNLYP